MTLWHETAGEGPPVLLVHAGICDARMWEPQWDALASGHRVVRCDLRGFGRTPIPPQLFSPAADLAELLELLDLGPAAVVGASYGGLVALDLALARPELVSRLVLADVPLPGWDWSAPMRELGAIEEQALAGGDLDQAVEANLRLWVDGPRGPGEVDGELRRLVGEMQRRAFELQVAAGDEADDELLTADVPGRLGELAAPALVVTGELDLADMQAIADHLVARFPDARRARIPGAAHLPSLERPAEFNCLVLGFLAG